MSDITVPPPNDPAITIIAEPPDCPFPDERLTMGFGFGGIPLTEDETGRPNTDRTLNVASSRPVRAAACRVRTWTWSSRASWSRGNNSHCR